MWGLGFIRVGAVGIRIRETSLRFPNSWAGGKTQAPRGNYRKNLPLFEVHQENPHLRSESSGDVGGERLPIEAEVLHLLELPNPFAGALTANPGLLYSPKGGGGIGNQAAVYPNHSGFDSFR